MAQHSLVPKFGNQEKGEDVQDTTYFENAGKGKKGCSMSPNDPRQDPKGKVKGQNRRDAFRPKYELHASGDDVESRKPIDPSLHQDDIGLKPSTYTTDQQHGVRSGDNKSESETTKGPEILRSRHENWSSQEEGHLKQPADSPFRHENAGRRTPVESPHHCHGVLSAADTPKRVSQQSLGSERSNEQSLLHPHSHAKIGGKGGGVSSPSWDRKVSSEGSHGLAPSTPGRSRLRSVTKSDEMPDDSPAVPKFGDWDEKDPASAEGFTQIFNRVRDEKQSGAVKVPIMHTETSYYNSQKRYGNGGAKGCFCFPWCKR